MFDLRAETPSSHGTKRHPRRPKALDRELHTLSLDGLGIRVLSGVG